MKVIKNIVVILFSLIVGFGLWYGIFFLFILEQNPLYWSFLQKLFFIIFSIVSTESIMRILGIDKNGIV